MNLKINGNIKSFDDSSMTVEGLVVKLNLLGKRIAIEKNGMIIAKSEFQNIFEKNYFHPFLNDYIHLNLKQ